jgi:hypothetical protein
MSDPLLYFNGVSLKGDYLMPPASAKSIGEALLQGGWDAPPGWVLDWTREHAVDDPRRKPVLETKRPWDLTETGWAVVFAPGIDPRVKTALGKLLEHRRNMIGKKNKHYFKECIYQGQTAYRFLKDQHANPAMRADPEHFPYYVLLVGDPVALPYKFQAELDVNYAVGRICFDRVEDYAAYADSVTRAEETARLRSREVVFFGTEHENDWATQRTCQDLVLKLAGSVLEPRMPWKVRPVLGEEARKAQLAKFLGGGETPAFLFAACHGLGFDFDGEDERQNACQGALVCQDWLGPASGKWVDEKHWLAASDVPDEANLQGLIAFLYACYGAGTPQRDNYDRNPLGKPRPIAPHALVSRLPQKLLSRPDKKGALAVIGHVDQAWATSFSGSPKGEGIDAFRYGVQRLLQGHTVGWAMEYINQSYATLATMRASLDEEIVNREVVDEEELAYLWLIRNDARNFVVFGDPAVRLPGVGRPR